MPASHPGFNSPCPRVEKGFAIPQVSALTTGVIGDIGGRRTPTVSPIEAVPLGINNERGLGPETANTKRAL